MKIYINKNEYSVKSVYEIMHSISHSFYTKNNIRVVDYQNEMKIQWRGKNKLPVVSGAIDKVITKESRAGLDEIKVLVKKFVEFNKQENE